MILTEEQARAATEQPSGVRLTDPGTNQEYVLMRADVFDQLRELANDDSAWTDEERDLVRAEAVESLGWEGMDVYQDDES